MHKTNYLFRNIDLTKIVQIYDKNNTSKTLKNVKNLNKFDDNTVDQIIELIILTVKIPAEEKETAWILLTGVLQLGGSNQKAGNSISYTVGEYTLTSQQLTNNIKKVVKNGTNRQLARSVANDVATIAITLNIPGDLHSQMALEFPNMSDAEKVWCSNFQTQNPNCPDNVREWLVENYKSRFNR